ncbi:MAG: hypothetical protein LCH26_04905 [Proteobacteria bacterium]|nr:hypothetical protein [Pseudomonadota bacterium]
MKSITRVTLLSLLSLEGVYASAVAESTPIAPAQETPATEMKTVFLKDMVQGGTIIVEIPVHGTVQDIGHALKKQRDIEETLLIYKGHQLNNDDLKEMKNNEMVVLYYPKVKGTPISHN